MPILNWIGKSKVVNHHLDVPFCVLKQIYSFDEKGKHSEDNGSKNMIIHGDNLLALKSLLPEYEGRINCIYIDPPYNTGKEQWVYNDNVNDPHIRNWLGKVVGEEGEDLSRHDKWLCMMYPRLRLLQKLLAEDGSLVISIGYQELHNLIAMLYEIFSTKQIMTITVQTSGGKPSRGFNLLHEYIIFVVPRDFNANVLDFCGGNFRTPFEGLTLSTYDKTQRPNQAYPIYIDNAGRLAGVGKSLQERIDDGSYKGRPKDFRYDYTIAPEGTVAVWPVTDKGKECVWRQIPQRLLSDWEKGYIKIRRKRSGNSGNEYSVQYLPSGIIKKLKSGDLEVLGHEDGVPTLRLGKNQTAGEQVPTIWSEKDFYTVKGTQMLKLIFPDADKVFEYPKPVALVESIIRAISKKDDIILDSFAGSGTTGHAVLNVNNDDGGNRQFILVETMDYAERITAERVKRVINGYGKGDDSVDGTGGNFGFYELGDQLFVGDFLNEGVGEEEIRKYVYFSETRMPVHPKCPVDPFLMGVFIDVAYYFYYLPNKTTTLNHGFLQQVGTKASSYVIYADTCTLSSGELEKWHITFKKIPRDIRKL